MNLCNSEETENQVKIAEFKNCISKYYKQGKKEKDKTDMFLKFKELEKIKEIKKTKEAKK
jgi:hypothetical protein